MDLKMMQRVTESLKIFKDDINIFTRKNMHSMLCILLAAFYLTVPF